ncbi:uncharacterized protein B0H18DRAFT_1027439 [Fomitopsis serialis]|uniref:uncharacterized protein n=1 Tax=Fomitopsis serialis TaxID=139415 RepID=UPI002007D25F|nr:uncharacterized protein B0H18DRAFT_1027439 [Neoantrodia serialis]KAH9919522.1 hypothetical protein B0H18DRAFT_1027439 [Neoantrodia serialis]
MTAKLDPNWHTVRVRPRRLIEFRSSLELVRTMADAITAHKGYYEAGFIHRNIYPEAIMTFEEMTPTGASRTYGVLLDLDNGASRREFRRGNNVATSGHRHASKSNVSENLGLDGQVSEL